MDGIIGGYWLIYPSSCRYHKCTTRATAAGRFYVPVVGLNMVCFRVRAVLHIDFFVLRAHLAVSLQRSLCNDTYGWNRCPLQVTLLCVGSPQYNGMRWGVWYGMV